MLLGFDELRTSSARRRKNDGAAQKAGALDAMSDAYVTADYRRHLARILAFRALEKATGARLEQAA